MTDSNHVYFYRLIPNHTVVAFPSQISSGIITQEISTYAAVVLAVRRLWIMAKLSAEETWIEVKEKGNGTTTKNIGLLC